MEADAPSGEWSGTTLEDCPTRVEGPQHWVELFREAFGGGSYASVARLHRLTHPDYRAVQPQTPDAIGPEGLLDLFSRLYALIPDLRGEVLTANVFAGGVYIEVRLSGTLGGRPITWDACDRFWFADGLAVGRVTYLDPTSLFSAVVRRPWVWRRWWRSGLGSPRRRIAKKLRPATLEAASR
ncbi:SnoaL-like domain-containing protein [Frankia sp. AiPs1]|uniref:nuclear transport factor 2 family protein n=1 Tax=Frankia sp. AiPa1 TaxID=573492 RepID=UPI00202B93C0|nr:nuclear transport factor 2 family protein [Frankia sp. AiPa1]